MSRGAQYGIPAQDAQKDCQQGRSENFPILYTSRKGSGRGCPLLRASNEHILIVRVLRARRAPGRLPALFLSILPNQIRFRSNIERGGSVTAREWDIPWEGIALV